MTFLSFLKRVHRPAAPSVPSGCRVYAIGDVHGRLDLLIELLDHIQADHEARAPAAATVVMLGDLIDRGQQSAQLLTFLQDERPNFANFHFLMGNHEEAMLESLRSTTGLYETGWLSFGGRETLISYGVPETLLAVGRWPSPASLLAYIPEKHMSFVASFEDSLMLGDYLFVHAGIRPGVALVDQDPRDLRWIRAPFLGSAVDHGLVIVHGHTIVPEPEERANRIGIDTGAFRSGVLTALALEGANRWYLATKAPNTANSMMRL